LSLSTDPRIGSELLGYRIEALLGRGGMSVVYRAHHVALDRKVALKLLAPELAEDERFRERFLRESKLAASLDHPSIVPIYDAGEVDGQLYIAMRYVEGSDLKHLLRADGALEPRRALRFVAQLGEALDFAHARGLVHRDVKPSNALLDGGEHLYLADFGLTKSASDRSALTATGRILGTVDYAAPEQIEGKPVDGRADVYSLGCMLFECLTGEVPFPKDSELAVLWAHVHERPPKASERNHDLPAALDAVIMRALAKDPEKRHATCGELVEAARQALGLRDVVVVRDRRPLLLAVVGALVAAGALAAGLVLALGDNGQPKPDLAVTKNTLVRIDPKTNKIAAVTKVGRPRSVSIGPVGVAAAASTVWVYNWDERNVKAIDPGTATIDRTVSLGAAPPSGQTNLIAADATGAWALSSRADGRGVLTHVRGGIELPQQFSFDYDLRAVAVGEGNIWVAGKKAFANAVLRISPRTGSVLATVPLRDAVVDTESIYRDVQSISVGEGAVWALQGGTIFRIDPSTARITGRVDLPGHEVTQVAAGAGSVWASMFGSDGNELVRVDPRTLRVTQSISALSIRGSQNSSLASHISIGEGAVWWIGADSGVVFRVDPMRGQIVSKTRLTPPVKSFADIEPFALAAGAGGIWVTVAIAP
jgi:tRNA A-37 threonylcarbamoyl transferase component Bud32